MSKLPEIPLPMFHGKIEDFTEFKKKFISLIAKKGGNLTNDQKLFY